MEAAAPPTATSSSPCGFLSLSCNLGILQLLPLFFLVTFCNASSCLHCSNSKKITAAVFVAVEFSDINHWHCYCIECGIVRPSKDPLLPWWKQQLHPQQQASAPVDFFLSQPGWSWNPATVASVSSCLILQCLIQPALQQQQQNHCSSICCCCIFWHQSTVRLHLWKRYFCRSRAAKDSDWFLSYFIKATFTSSNNQPLEMINPSPPDLLKSGQNRLRKTHNPQIFKFHKLWHALICSVYLWAHKLKILSAGFLLCPIIRKT